MKTQNLCFRMALCELSKYSRACDDIRALSHRWSYQASCSVVSSFSESSGRWASPFSAAASTFLYNYFARIFFFQLHYIQVCIVDLITLLYLIFINIVIITAYTLRSELVKPSAPMDFRALLQLIATYIAPMWRWFGMCISYYQREKIISCFTVA